MRSLALIVIGLIAGIAVNRMLNHSETNPPLVVEAPPARTPASEPPSPFTVVKPAQNPAPRPIPPQTSDSSPATSINDYQIADTDILNIRHYRELADFLQQLDTANSSLLEEFSTRLNSANPSNHFATAIHTAVFQRWAVVDIDSALQHVLRNTNNNYHSSRYHHDGLTILAAAQPDIVEAWFDTLTRQQQQMFEYQVRSGITATDPERYARQALADDNLDDGTFYSAIMQWGETDPAAAWAFLQESVTQGAIDHRYTGLLYQWIEQEPATALAELETQLQALDQSDPQGFMLQEMYATTLARTDPEAALQWLTEKLSNVSVGQGYTPDIAFGLLSNTLYVISEQNPQMIDGWFNQLTETQRQQLLPIALPVLVDSLVNTDPLRALELAEQMPDEHGYDNREMVVQQWIYTDTPSATAWLNALPASSENEQLKVNAAISLIHEDTNAALALLNQSTTPLTTDLVFAALTPLSHTDPDAARQWLQQQSNPNLIETGNLIIDINQQSSSTTEILNRIEQLNNKDDRRAMVMELMNNSSPEDSEAIIQWALTTSALSDPDRTALQRMLDPASFYPRTPHDFYNRMERFSAETSSPPQE